MSYFKSRMACEFTLHKLAQNLQGGSRVHLWTFTMPFVYSPRKTASAWSALRRELVRRLGFWGVRVFELHPGGHGLHVHVVTSGWYDVNAVRILSDSMGWGRIHVKCMDGGVTYVAKYLHKARRSGVLRGLRLWEMFGQAFAGFVRTRCIDVESDTLVGREYKKLFAEFFHESIGLEGIILRKWCFSLCRAARARVLRPYAERVEFLAGCPA